MEHNQGCSPFYFTSQLSVLSSEFFPLFTFSLTALLGLRCDLRRVPVFFFNSFVEKDEIFS